MEAVLFKSKESIGNGGVNLKYNVINILNSAAISIGYIRYKYFSYYNKHNSAPNVHAISYNGSLSVYSDYGTCTLEKTETVGSDVLRYYLISPQGRVANYGVYGIQHGSATKILIEDVEGCTLWIMGTYTSSSVKNVIDNDNCAIHFNRNIVNPTGFIQAHGSEDIYGINYYSPTGLCTVNDLGQQNIKIGTKTWNISDLNIDLPYASGLRLMDSPVTGYIEDIADYICIDGYKAQSQKCFTFGLVLQRTGITGSYDTFLERLKARGAKTLFVYAYFAGQSFVPQNGYHIYYFDENGNYTRVSENDTSQYLQ